MITKDSDFLARAEAEAKAEANKEFQQQAKANQIARNAETLAPDIDRVRTDLQAQIGRALPQADIEKRLRKLIVGVRFERSNANPAATGIYVKDTFITAFATGVSPEFSLMEKTKQGHGRELIRGWRTMLSQLIRKGYIGQVAAETAFDIVRGPDSARWHQIMN